MPTRKDKEGYWHAEACVGRERLHRRLPLGSTASDAKRVEASLRKSLDKPKRKAIVIPGDPRLTDIMADYMTYCDNMLRSPKSSKEHAAAIGPWMIGHTASEARAVTNSIIEDMTPYYEVGTINRRLGCFKKALSNAFDKGKTEIDYSAYVKRPGGDNVRSEHLTMDQVKLIADHASENVRAAIWIALFTGCRRGEICKIKQQDIGDESIRIPARNTKTLKYRELPITGALRPWMKYLPMPIKPASIKSGFATAREKAGFGHITYHDIRHSCATILLSLGVPLVVIRDVLGHASIRTTERYASSVIGSQREALEKMTGLHRDLHPAEKQPKLKIVNA